MVIEIAALLIGTLCLFFGYKLLMRGIYPDHDADATVQNQGLFKRGTPGLLFSMFGVVIIVAAILHSTHARHHERAAVTEETEPSTPAEATQTPRSKHTRAKEPRHSTARTQTVQPKAIAPVPPVEPALEDAAPVQQPAKYAKPGRA
jgi:hypothetical protein